MERAGIPPFTLRVYYEDTDAGGVVYYANYLNFAERARTETLRALGFDQSRLREEDDILFVVRSVAIDYLRPARLDDRLTIETHLADSGRVSLRMRQIIRRESETLATLEVKLAVVNATLTPVPLPPRLRDAFSTLLLSSPPSV